jgi:hypothetical protein
MKKKKQRYIEPWYAVKCLFQNPETKTGPRQRYEERIILVKSNNFPNALKKADREAKKYAKDSSNCKYVGRICDFHLFDNYVGDLTEIYSEIRRSNLSPKEYIAKYYPEDRLDDCEKDGLTHRWYNKDNKNSACYECNVVKPGRLWEEE